MKNNKTWFSLSAEKQDAFTVFQPDGSRVTIPYERLKVFASKATKLAINCDGYRIVGELTKPAESAPFELHSSPEDEQTLEAFHAAFGRRQVKTLHHIAGVMSLTMTTRDLSGHPMPFVPVS